MNKNIATLILAVLVFAMGLIVVNQFRSGGKTAPATEQARGSLDPAGKAATADASSSASQTDGSGKPVAGAAMPGQGSGTMSPPVAGLAAPGGTPPMAGGVMPLDGTTLKPTDAAPSGSGAAGGVAEAPHAGGSSFVDQAKVPAKATTPAKAATSAKAAPSATAKAAPAAPAAKPAAAATAKAAPAAKTASTAGDHAITSAKVQFEGNSAVLKLQGNAPIEYKYFVLKNPDRVVVDLQGAWQVKAPGVPSNNVVKNVRVGRQGENTRVVLDLLKTSTPGFAKPDAKTLEVRVK